MFSPSDAHIATSAPSNMPIKRKLAPFRRLACLVHDLPMKLGREMDALAIKKLSVARSHRSQVAWASCIVWSDDARELLGRYARNSSLPVLTSGGARALLAQKLVKTDAIEIASLLKKTGEDAYIVAYLSREYPIIKAVLTDKVDASTAIKIVLAQESGNIYKIAKQGQKASKE